MFVMETLGENYEQLTTSQRWMVMIFITKTVVARILKR